MGAVIRRIVAFACEGASLVGTLDPAPGTTGLLIVSGGNEVRAGAHRGLALLAARLAASGIPVFRYDRRGVGDSEGANGGYASAAADMIAAARAFRDAAPQVATLVGFGNCDAASALALFGHSAGVERIVLANPWVVEVSDDLPASAAIRSRYRARMTDPAFWWRLVRGGVDLRKAVRGVRKLARREPRTLAARVAAAIEGWGSRACVVLATRDATALAFKAAAPHLRFEPVDTASHSFAGESAAALEAAIRRALR